LATTTSGWLARQLRRKLKRKGQTGPGSVFGLGGRISVSEYAGSHHQWGIGTFFTTFQLEQGKKYPPSRQKKKKSKEKKKNNQYSVPERLF
jgi:hypothetical protein